MELLDLQRLYRHLDQFMQYVVMLENFHVLKVCMCREVIMCLQYVSWSYNVKITYNSVVLWFSNV